MRSREVLKPWDWEVKLLHRFEIWQAHWQYCCRGTCQNSKCKYCTFETSQDHKTSYRILKWDPRNVCLGRWLDVQYMTVMSHEHDISNHWQLECLFNSVFRLTTKKKPRLHNIGPLWGDSTSDWLFPWQMVSNVESIHISWQHNDIWAPSQYKDRLIYVWRFPC